jgi:hypothetical protein
MEGPPPIDMLLVEDNPADISLVRRAVEEPSCLALGANAYAQKLVDFTAHFGSIQALVRHWLGAVCAPPQAEGRDTKGVGFPVPPSVVAVQVSVKAAMRTPLIFPLLSLFLLSGCLPLYIRGGQLAVATVAGVASGVTVGGSPAETALPQDKAALLEVYRRCLQQSTVSTGVDCGRYRTAVLRATTR